MKDGKMFIIISLLCFNALFIKAQDKIHTTDNTVIEAKVIEINDAEIKYKKFSNPNGPSYVIDKLKVSMIVYENGEKDIFNQNKTSAIPQGETIKPVQATPVNDSIKKPIPKTVSSGSNEQKGTIKIFSELKGVKVYLDEVLKGTDIITIDAVPSGSHYIKVIKDDVIVLGELITVNDNAATTILLKDTKEVQDKLLAGKYKEQEMYKSMKLDVLLDTKYITETTGNTNTTGQTKSLYFPGYYSVMGSSKTAVNTESKSVSVTSAVTEWFITKGKGKITQYEFAGLTNNKSVISNYENQKREFEAKCLKRAKRGRVSNIIVSATLAIGSGIVAMSMAPNVNWDLETGAVGPQMLCIFSGIMSAGMLGMFIGTLCTKPRCYGSFGEFSYLSLDEAIRQAKVYNQNLKNTLGLPENYEP